MEASTTETNDAMKSNYLNCTPRSSIFGICSTMRFGTINQLGGNDQTEKRKFIDHCIYILRTRPSGTSQMSMSSQQCPSKSTNVMRAWIVDLLSRVHDDDNRNGLWYAVKNGDDVVAGMILDYGIDINEYDNYGSIVLFEALELENLEMLKLLLERGSHTTDKFGNSAIVEAASNGNKRAVAILLDFGVDVNNMDPDGRTALHKAGEAGDVEMVEMLLDKGANADPQDKEDRTPLIEAVEAG